MEWQSSKSKESTDCRRWINMYYLRFWIFQKQQISKGVVCTIFRHPVFWIFKKQQIIKGGGSEADVWTAFCIFHKGMYPSVNKTKVIMRLKNLRSENKIRKIRLVATLQETAKCIYWSREWQSSKSKESTDCRNCINIY